MNLTAFLSYVFLTAFTPGPNVIMAMTIGSKYGFRKALRFNLGVLSGFLIVLSACAAFFALLFRSIPIIEPIMKWAGAGYILWLAWSVWRDKPADEGLQDENHRSEFLSGFLLQFVNPKLYMFGITALSTFVLPHTRSFTALAGTVLLLSAIAFAASCSWAIFGSVFTRIFKRQQKALNLVMALLLAYCAITLILG